jgi:hypothetical protein
MKARIVLFESYTKGFAVPVVSVELFIYLCQSYKHVGNFLTHCMSIRGDFA